MRSRIALVALASCFLGTAAAQIQPTVVVRSIAPPQPTGPAVQKYGVTRDDLDWIESMVPTAQMLVPIRYVLDERVRVGDQSIKATITGTTHEYSQINPLKIVRGRFLTEDDVAKRNNVVVINTAHANALFNDDDAIGQPIQFNQEYFTVVGIVQADAPASVFLPYTTMKSRLGDRIITRKAGMFEMREYELSEIAVVLNSSLDVRETAERITAIMNKFHSQQDFNVKVKP